MTAVIGAIVPITWGFVRGERPSVLTLVGMGLAVVAGAFISAESDEMDGPFGRALPLALAAGVGFGCSFILFATVAHGSGFWPVLFARAAAVVAVASAVGILRLSPSRLAGATRLGVGAGVLDVTASSLLLVALRHGLIAVVAPVASLAPGFTVTHAWWYLRERTSALQVVGIGMAIVGLALIAIG